MNKNKTLSDQLKIAKGQQTVINKELEDSEVNLLEAEEWNWLCMEKSINIEKHVRSLASKLSWAKRNKHSIAK